jgi:hypothetical protein
VRETSQQPFIPDKHLGTLPVVTFRFWANLHATTFPKRPSVYTGCPNNSVTIYVVSQSNCPFSFFYPSFPIMRCNGELTYCYCQLSETKHSLRRCFSILTFALHLNCYVLWHLMSYFLNVNSQLSLSGDPVKWNKALSWYRSVFRYSKKYSICC